ncbi:ribokinase [Deinococcus seoulensis]|uniref:Ribokinase n=1 Tax=Deinococcus seoulensis TaxID=1837379 RepID=A0ABQ2RUV4_9DEIO|nr:ribokinase [Deinococcus seoulensis]GGR58798.1 ribokinase [Deinococcus seoulensis]
MILVAGSANLDFITRVPHLPRPGETVLGPAFTTAPGGKGANQAVACARSGHATRFFGALGDDPYAAPLRASFAHSGVQDTSLTLDAPTGAAFITVADSGENVIAVASGANARLTPDREPDFTDVTHLILQLEIPLPAVQAYARAARQRELQVILNAAPAPQAPLPAGLLADVNVLVVNEGELSTLVGPGDLPQQLRAAQTLGPQTVIVTLGGQGAAAVQGDHWLEVPAHPVTVRDTTGAGDTFVGVLTGALGAGLSLPQAMQEASVAASLACTREGAQPSMPSRAEIDHALKSDPDSDPGAGRPA